MKKEIKTEITKERILNAALEEFGTYGYYSGSVNHLCQKYSISKGLIYYNFKNKDDLYLCCLDSAVNDFISYMGNEQYNTDLKMYMKKRNSFFEHYPYHSRIIFESILTDDVSLKSKFLPIKKKFDDFNIKLYSHAIDGLKLRKGVSKENALEYYSLLQNMFNSYCNINIKSESGIENRICIHERELEKILDYMLFGIAEEEI